MMTPGTYLALDIGATKIEAGRVRDGLVMEVCRVPTTPFCTRDELLRGLARALSAVTTGDASGLGVGFPGLLDYGAGALLGESVFPDVEGFALRSHLSDLLRLPVALDTDANLAAIGVGAVVEYRNFAVLTIGSGTGVGLFLDGALARGDHGIPDAVYAALAESGGRRHTSGYLFPEVYGTEGEELARLAHLGDSDARRSFERIGEGVAAVVNALAGRLNLEAIALTGGVVRSLRFFERSMRDSLRATRAEVFVPDLEYPALLGGALLAARASTQDPTE